MAERNISYEHTLDWSIILVRLSTVTAFYCDGNLPFSCSLGASPGDENCGSCQWLAQ